MSAHSTAAPDGEATSAAAPLTLYDTMTGAKRPVALLRPGVCTVYCCGPTTYDMSHIGHARAALAPDLLVRWLRASGLTVRYVRNVTDIDDKIIARASERGEDPTALATRYLDEYHRDLAGLGTIAPDVEPKVSDHIQQIIALIGKLFDAGLAYARGGDVYYRVDKFAEYGRLSQRRLDDMQAGARVEVDERKEHPLDFVLWKAAKAGEPAWDSPWGPGRPGWHIECSAMSCEHLGVDFDIHAGGRDLIFPHHENEIAQSQGAHGVGTFARHWMHNGFVNFAGEKMSKSLGNFFTIREVTGLYEPEVLRYAMIAVHYRNPINFDVEVPCPACGTVLGDEDQAAQRCSACGATPTVEAMRARIRFPQLEEADDRLAYIYETLRTAAALLADADPNVRGAVEPMIAQMKGAFDAAMADDLNTAAALAELSEPLSLANRMIASGKGMERGVRLASLRAFLAHMRHVSAVLGCFGADPTAWLAARRDRKVQRLGLDAAAIDALVEARTQARADKQWARADELRRELERMGVEVRDAGATSTWTV